MVGIEAETAYLQAHLAVEKACLGVVTQLVLAEEKPCPLVVVGKAYSVEARVDVQGGLQVEVEDRRLLEMEAVAYRLDELEVSDGS